MIPLNSVINHKQHKNVMTVIVPRFSFSFFRALTDVPEYYNDTLTVSKGTP